MMTDNNNIDKPNSIWLDCDPGHDDAFAILLSLFSPKIKLLGISTVHGNQSTTKTTINALTVLEIAGKSNQGFEVVKGVEVPLVRPSMVCPEIHGETGLDIKTTTLPKPTQLPITDRPAIQVMFEKITKQFNETNEIVTIVATGSLTNVALLLIVYPQIKSMIQVSLLGGAINFGNMTPAAEYNILVDPDAASVVFNSGIKVIMVPLECSHKALATTEILDRISSLDKNGSSLEESQFIKIIKGLLLYFTENYKTLFGFENGPPLHDPLAVAYLIDPTIFTCKLMRVDIENTSQLCLGRTVVDLFGFSKLTKNVHVCTDIQENKFWDIMINAIELCYNSLNKK